MSATLLGVEAIPVTVEVMVSNGLPGMSIVGMGDTAVQEARERVKTAIAASGFVMPNEKIVVNLAPGGLKKTGTGFDLPIAIGILAATAQIPLSAVKERLFVGELSLEGPVREVLGILAYGICAYKLGLSLVSSGNQFVPVDGLEQLGLRSLGRLHSQEAFDPVSRFPCASNLQSAHLEPDFKDIAGHEIAKRALQIAAAGRHGVLMVGPPGAGKTMLASRVASILPALEQREIIESAVIHSVAGEDITEIINGIRPFRKPHHSISAPGLLGGGRPIGPGEISLAHCGVLFLDEIAEFKPSVLQGLRQPMESGSIIVSRADGNVRFPADFTLIAASNPCPCGYFGDSVHECKCTDSQITKYQSKIGGPLLDRIDIQLDIQRLPTKSVLETGEGISSKKLREGVLRARKFAEWRTLKSNSIRMDEAACQDEITMQGKEQVSIREHPIALSTPAAIIDSCRMDDEGSKFLESAAERENLSGRALINTLKVARTIADMEEQERVGGAHIAEAMGFRMRCGG